MVHSPAGSDAEDGGGNRRQESGLLALFLGAHLLSAVSTIPLRLRRRRFFETYTIEVELPQSDQQMMMLHHMGTYPFAFTGRIIARNHLLRLFSIETLDLWTGCLRIQMRLGYSNSTEVR